MSKSKSIPLYPGTSITKDSKVVTLYIQAHGDQGSDEIMIYGLHGRLIDLSDVNLLSFCGFPGFCGYTAEKCLDQDDYAIDIWVMDNLRYLYNEHNPKPKNYQWEILEEVADILRIGFKTECNLQYSGYGFRQTSPRSERLFTYYPTIHENCINCLGKKDDSTCKYVEEPDINKHECPEYGIVVIESSEKEDNGFTLLNPGRHTTKELNLRSPESNSYWHKKALSVLNSFEAKCKKEKNYSANRRIKNFRKKINNLFENIIKPYSENPSSTLTEILQSFTIMGFTHIIILDPTCRSIDKYNLATEDYNEIKAFKDPVALDIYRKERRRDEFYYEDEDEDNADNNDDEPPISSFIQRDFVMDLEPKTNNTDNRTWGEYMGNCIGDWCKKTKKAGKKIKRKSKLKRTRKNKKIRKKRNK